MKIKKKSNDLGFAFVAMAGSNVHWPYLCVIRPKDNQVFLEAYGNHLFHFSLHKPRPGADVADCHYSIPQELLRDNTVLIEEEGPSRKLMPWQRRVGSRAVSPALHLIFPEQYALQDLKIPEGNMLQGCSIQRFNISAGQALHVEALFGPQDDQSWRTWFRDYGGRKEYFDLDNGERFCLNFFLDEKDYSRYRPIDDHKQIMLTKDGHPPGSVDYNLLFGPYGEYTIGVVHGSPKRVD